MIGNPYKGRSFKGLIRYLHHGRSNDPKPHRVVWSAGRNIATTNDTAVTAIMAYTAELSSGVKKPVYHLPISWPPEEQLPKETQLEIADTLLSDLGLSEHQTLIVAHDDGDCPHIHIVINTVHPETGRVWNAWRDVYRIMESLERQEKELGLRIVTRPDLEAERSGNKNERDKDNPTREERKRAERVDDTPLVKWSEAEMRERRKVITDHFKKAESWADLDERLAGHGLHLIKAGQGFRITDGTHFMTMSKVGKHAREDKLEARFGVSWEEHQLTREDPELTRQIEPPDSDDDEALTDHVSAEAERLDEIEQRQQRQKRISDAAIALKDYQTFKEREEEARMLAVERVQISREQRRQAAADRAATAERDIAQSHFDRLIQTLYRNPKKALANINKERARGKDFKDIDLAKAGRFRGVNFYLWKNTARLKAQEAMKDAPAAFERLRRLEQERDKSRYFQLRITARMSNLVERVKETGQMLGRSADRKTIGAKLFKRMDDTVKSMHPEDIEKAEHLTKNQRRDLERAREALDTREIHKERHQAERHDRPLEQDTIDRSDMPIAAKRRLNEIREREQAGRPAEQEQELAQWKADRDKRAAEESRRRALDDIDNELDKVVAEEEARQRDELEDDREELNRIEHEMVPADEDIDNERLTEEDKERLRERERERIREYDDEIAPDPEEWFQPDHDRDDDHPER